MKENSIEETIKQLKLMLKVRKEQKEIIECAGGSCINCDPDIKALSESIDILSDYKRVLKENEGLRKSNKIYALQGSNIKLEIYIKDNYLSKQKVKDKIEHYQKLQDNYIEKYDEINEGLQAMINALQELLEGRK